MENNKYLNGKIYKIVSTQTAKVYIGSTVQKYLCNRMQKHKFDYKTKQKYITSYEIVQFNDAKIVLLEEYPCATKTELRKREQHWIDSTPNCVNNKRAYVTDNQKKQTVKNYYNSHKEKIINYKHQWYKKRAETEEFQEKSKKYKEDHKEYYENYSKKYREENYKTLQQKKKQYNISHKDQLSQKRREHYELNKSKIKADNSIKYHCEFCNTTLTKCKKSRHVKCKKHIQGVIKDMQEFRNLVEIHRQTRLAKNEANRRLFA